MPKFSTQIISWSDLDGSIISKLHKLRKKVEHSKALSVIGVIGAKRSGKSTLLNFLAHFLNSIHSLDCNNGPWFETDCPMEFEVDSENEPVTNGVWIRKHLGTSGSWLTKNGLSVFKGQDVLLVDFEGLFDEGQSIKQRSILAGLALTMCTTIVYKSYKDFNTDKLDHLLILSRIAKHLQPAGITKRFLVLIGDYTLGSELGYSGGGKYLMDNINRAKPETTHRYKELQENLGTQLQWFLCPPPENSNPRTQNLSLMGYKFGTIMAQFIESVAAPGYLALGNLTGADLCNLCQTFFSHVAKSDFQDMEEVSTVHKIFVQNKAVESALAAFADTFGSPEKPTDYISHYQVALRSGLATFHKSALLIGRDTKEFQKLENDLIEKCAEKAGHFAETCLQNFEKMIDEQFERMENSTFLQYPALNSGIEAFANGIKAVVTGITQTANDVSLTEIDIQFFGARNEAIANGELLQHIQYFEIFRKHVISRCSESLRRIRTANSDSKKQMIENLEFQLVQSYRHELESKVIDPYAPYHPKRDLKNIKKEAKQAVLSKIEKNLGPIADFDSEIQQMVYAILGRLDQLSERTSGELDEKNRNKKPSDLAGHVAALTIITGGAGATICSGSLLAAVVGVATGGVGAAIIGGGAVVGVCVYGTVVLASGARKFSCEELGDYNKKIYSSIQKKYHKTKDSIRNVIG